jgi:outer membrane protein
MTTRFTLVASFAFATLTPIGLAAQQAATIPATVTLEDALRIARRNSPAFLKLQNDTDVPSMSVRRSWSQFLPTVSSSMNFNGNSSTTTTGTDNFGGVVTNPQPITVKSSTAGQGISLGMTLFDGGAMFRNLSAARADVDATEASVVAAMANEAAVVENAFFAARQADMLVQVEQQNLDRAKSNYERSQELFRMAAVKQHELLDAQRSVLSSEKSLRARETDALKARLDLAQRMGIEPGTAFAVAEQTPEVFDPAAIDADALVASGVEQSPLVRQRRAQVEAGRRRVSAAKGAWLPQITASLGYGRNTGEQGFGAIGELNPDRSRGYNFSFGFSLPLFNRFQTSASVTQATVQREDAESDLRASRLDVEARIRSGLLDLSRSYEDSQLAEQIATITQQQAGLADEQFRLGALSFLDYQRLIDQNVQAQRDAVLARFDFNRVRVALEQTLGSPINR